MDPDEKPAESVEEAGALLGAAITRYGSAGACSTINPPKGTHSSFSILSPVPSSELLMQLHSLRSLLRSAPRDTPLVAAPSLLAVLMKLLGVSSNLASPGASGDPNRRTAISPMLSTPLRKLWIDCVVLCHTLGEGLSGNSRMNIYGFVRNMIQLAAMNPRTARAAGGTRIAALEVIAGLMREEALAKQLSSWALDVIQLCQRALKSSGNGEPSYRIAAIDMAHAAIVASRTSFLSTRPGSNPLVLKGALEDKAIIEMVRLFKTAVADKSPEVRSGAAHLASALAPMLLHTSIKSPTSPDAIAASPVVSLEDVMTIAMKNIDDEIPMVATGWAEALARCMSTSIAFSRLLNAEKSSSRNIDADGSMPDDAAGKRASGGGRGARRGVVLASYCTTLPDAMKYLVKMFIKTGGELTVPRSSGTFSAGGRALRHGFGRTMVHLLRLQSTLEEVGEGKSISHKDAILIILDMVGKEFQQRLSTASGHSGSNNLFGQAPKVSPADATLARGAASRVLREGISELASESTQISVLHVLNQLCEQGISSMLGGQLQVLLIEVSHLLAALGEATASALDDLLPTLLKCLRHADQGVRHEAAVAVAAVTSIFPSEGRKMVQENINTIQLEHAELLAVASTKKADVQQETQLASRFTRFRRQATPVKDSTTDESSKHKHALHGMALMISMVLRDLPTLPGGLPSSLLEKAILLAEILVNTMFNEIMTNNNPGGVCTCVRGGFEIICCALAAGPAGIEKHVSLIFALWQKVAKQVQRGGNFKPPHELVCIEAMLESTVCFLRYSSELLLSVPDALSTTTILLEEVLPLLSSNGRLGKLAGLSTVSSHLNGAKAAMLESFSWLPPGSYPMAADSVFAFSANHIQLAVENDVSCSILRSLISKEDMLLDATTFTRATRPGQVGGAVDLENDIIALAADVASHVERESVFPLLKTSSVSDSKHVYFLESEILGYTLSTDRNENPPTALHAVGTWRRPAMPSCSSRVRLVDASIQAFAATFTLKSGKEQQGALQMLQALPPPAHFQMQRSADRGKKEYATVASETNIAAVLLSCLKALPVFESTHNIPIHLGPMWMNKAKDVFIGMLLSNSHEVRRAASEGLGFLSTLGVREDASFLQSAILHSLDEVISGTQAQDMGKSLSVEAISLGKSAALLTLACMHRTAYRIKKEREVRARERGSALKENEEGDDSLPLFQVFMKVLPSIAIRPTGGFLGVRASGLHAFGIIFEYSQKLGHNELEGHEEHLLRKIVELIEDNYLSSWTTASHDYDHGTDSEKLASEAAFIAVVIRQMTFLTPLLYRLKPMHEKIASRFSKMVALALDCWGSHPVVEIEAMAFFEVLSAHQDLLPAHNDGVNYGENELLWCIPVIMRNLQPQQCPVHPVQYTDRSNVGLFSPHSMQVSLKILRSLSRADIVVVEWSDLKIVSLLYAALENFVTRQTFANNTTQRYIAAPRESELTYKDGDTVVADLFHLMRFLVALERAKSPKCIETLLRYILLSRSVLMGATSIDEDDEDEDATYTVARVAHNSLKRANLDAEALFDFRNAVRWQVKTIAAQVLTLSLREMTAKCRNDGLDPLKTAVFNPKLAENECRVACRERSARGAGMPNSTLALHIGPVVTAACATSTATVDQAELRCLQETSMHLITQVIESFGGVPDPESQGKNVLSEFIPQIASSLKNALSAPSEDDGERTCSLFYSGCETLQAFLKQKVSDDRGVLKRVVRPIMPAAGDMAFLAVDASTFESKADEDEIKNLRSNLLLPISKLWTISSIPASDTDLMALLGEDEASVGSNAAALAIDGARLLMRSGLSLSGTPKEYSSLVENSFSKWNCFETVDDIDDFVKAALGRTWARLAVIAVSLLSKSIASSAKKEEIEMWIKRLVPLLFVGFHDATNPAKEEPGAALPVHKLYESIISNEIGNACIQGIAILGSNDNILGLDESWRQKIEAVIVEISKSIFDPVVDSSQKDSLQSIELEVVKASCSLLLSLVRSASFAVAEESAVLLSILQPIALLEEGNANLSDSRCEIVVSTCLSAMSFFVAKTSTSESLVKAMVAVVLKASSHEHGLPESVKKALGLLLKECLANDAIAAKGKSSLALAMAKQKDWNSWTIVVRNDDGKSAKASLEIVCQTLLDKTTPLEQLAALTSLRTLLQTTPPPNPLTGRVLCMVAPEVMSILQSFGTQEVPNESKRHVTNICAEGIKVILVAVQQFSADGTSEEDMAQFLLNLFPRLIAVLRFNGLPNHPSPQPGLSDPSVGRMCAQAITHIARITPVPFKNSMGLMTEPDRAVLEFAVRAEMSGYAPPAGAASAPKKKLNLKSFKK